MANVVLVHGAYQGGWIWQPVVARLTAGGHRVYAPSLDGCAERRHSLRPGITTETHGAEIAVTHDDRYFHCADRVVKMEFGRIDTTA